MSIVASDLIKDSLGLIGVVGPGATVENEDVQDALRALNRLLSTSSLNRNLIYALTKENFTLTPGTNSYTYGSGGAFNSARPIKIESAYIRDSNSQDSPVEVTIDQDRWNRISLKTTQGRPYILLYDPQYTLGKVYLYYTPDIAYSLYIDAWKALTQISSSATTINMPDGYEEFLVYNLAVRLAPSYGVSVPAEVAMIAEKSERAIESGNARIMLATFDDMPSIPRTMDINTGD